MGWGHRSRPPGLPSCRPSLALPALDPPGQPREGRGGCGLVAVGVRLGCGKGAARVRQGCEPPPRPGAAPRAGVRCLHVAPLTRALASERRGLRGPFYEYGFPRLALVDPGFPLAVAWLCQTPACALSSDRHGIQGGFVAGFRGVRPGFGGCLVGVWVLLRARCVWRGWSTEQGALPCNGAGPRRAPAWGMPEKSLRSAPGRPERGWRGTKIMSPRLPPRASDLRLALGPAAAP